MMKFWICKISIVLLVSSCAFGADTPYRNKENLTHSSDFTESRWYYNDNTITINRGVKGNYTYAGTAVTNQGTFINYGEVSFADSFINQQYRNAGGIARFYGNATATRGFNNGYGKSGGSFYIIGATLTGNFYVVNSSSSLFFEMANGKMGNIVGNFGNSGGSVSVNINGMAFDTRYTIISGGTINGLTSSNISYTGTITADGYRFYYENGQVWLGKESDPSNPSPSNPNTPTPPPSDLI